MVWVHLEWTTRERDDMESNVECSRWLVAELKYVPYKLGVVFFFQAEDGIRDVAVTGVQTCALPISLARSRLASSSACGAFCVGQPCICCWAMRLSAVIQGALSLRQAMNSNCSPPACKIGRASCRERV